MDFEQPLPSEAEAPTEQSGLGVASFVISIVASIILIIVVFYAGYAESASPYGMDEGAAAIVGLLFILCIGLLILALILGLIALFQKQYRRTFAGIGVGISVFMMLAMSGLIWLGMQYG